MSIHALCDLCGRKMPPCRYRWHREENYSFPFRLGRKVVYLGVAIYQGKPGLRRRAGSDRNHRDLCRDCTARAIVRAAHFLNKEVARSNRREEANRAKEKA